MQYYPLRKAQQNVFYHWRIDPFSTSYNLSGRYRFPRTYSFEEIQAALYKVLEIHPQLYMRYCQNENGDVVQYMDRDSIKIKYILLRDDQIENFDIAFVRPFNILEESVVRFVVVHTETHTYLYQDIYHISFDGASFTIFKQNLERALKGEELVGERLSLDELISRENSLLDDDRIESELSYFKNMLAKAPSCLYPQPKQSEIHTHLTRSWFVPNDQVMTFCLENKLQVNSVLTFAVSTLLSRLSREHSVLMGIVNSGRPSHQYFTNVGMFVRTLPFVVDYSEDRTIIDQINVIQQSHSDLWLNKYAHLDDLITEFGVELPFIFIYQKVLDDKCELITNLQRLQIDANKQIVMEVLETKEHFEFRLTYIKELYQEAYVDTFVEACQSILENLVKSPESLVSALPIVSTSQKDDLLSLSYGGKLEYDKSLTFIDSFNDRARKIPSSLAIYALNGEMTYAQLGEYSDFLAGLLLNMGVGEGSFVSILLPRIKEYVAVMMATLKSGAAYIPLDILSPTKRISEVLVDSKSKVLVCTKELLDANTQLVEDVEYVMILDKKGRIGCLRNIRADIDSQLKGVNYRKCPARGVKPINNSKPSSLAYMIYTSGTTGKSKGVMISNYSLMAYLNSWKGESFEIYPTDRVSAYANFCFDASIDEVYGSLYAGASLYIVPDEVRYDIEALASLIQKNKITWAGFPPQFGAELIRHANLSLRVVFLGGEVLKNIPKTDLQIVNGYGPTEFTVTATSYTLRPGESYSNIPIGRPFKNVWSYVLDENLQFVPKGLIGELYLSGAQMTQGYWGDLALTNQKIINNPYSDSPENALMYATGDLVQWNSDGNLEYVGRKDSQVKLRGFRVELGEIENAILSYDLIDSCAVKLVNLNSRDSICAYYCTNTGFQVDMKALRAFLSKCLNLYQLPSYFVFMDALPTKASGKVDYDALPTPGIENTDIIPPKDETQDALRLIVCDLLSLPDVSVEENLTELGLDSLGVLTLIARANKDYGLKIKYSDVFTYNSIAKLSNHILSESPSAKEETYSSTIQNYSYGAISHLLRTRMETSDLSVDTLSGTVLLAGASGYLGAHLLEKLLEKDGITKVYCLVRKNRYSSAKEHLTTVLNYYFGTSLDEYIDKRIIVLEGDLTSESEDSNSRAIKRKELELLCEKIDVDLIINSAANVRHYSADNSIIDDNLSIVQVLIDFAMKRSIKLLHISTNSVGSDLGDKINESMLYEGQIIDNQYIYSKFISERLVLEAVNNGLDAQIMRVGNLTPRYRDGVFQINPQTSVFLMALRYYSSISQAHSGRISMKSFENIVDISPVDLTADAIVRLLHLKKPPLILHPFNSSIFKFGWIINTMNSNSKLLSPGIEFDSYSKAELEWPMIMAVDNKITTDILSSLEWKWPKIDKKYLNKLKKLLSF